jgi:hypothetical protein
VQTAGSLENTLLLHPERLLQRKIGAQTSATV